MPSNQKQKDTAAKYDINNIFLTLFGDFQTKSQ